MELDKGKLNDNEKYYLKSVRTPIGTLSGLLAEEKTKIRQNGYLFIEHFDGLDENQIKIFLKEKCSLNEIRGVKVSKKIKNSCTRLNPLSDNFHIKKDKYKHSTRKRIIDLGFTSWTDLAIYVLSLKEAEKRMYLNKYIRLIHRTQQDVFLDRLVNILYDFITNSESQFYNLEWAFGFRQGLSEKQIKGFLRKGILSPFQIILENNSYKEAFSNYDLEELMKGEEILFIGLCFFLKQSYIALKQKEIEFDISIHDEFSSYTRNPYHYDYMVNPDYLVAETSKSTFGLNVNDVEISNCIEGNRCSFAFTMPCFLVTNYELNFINWCNPVIEFCNFIKAASLFETIDIQQQLYLGCQLVIAYNKEETVQTGTFYWDEATFREVVENTGDRTYYANINANSMWLKQTRLDDDKKVFKTITFQKNNLSVLDHHMGFVLSSLQNYKKKDYVQVWQALGFNIELQVSNSSGLPMNYKIFERIRKRTLFFYEKCSFFSMQFNSFKLSPYTDSKHNREARIKQPFMADESNQNTVNKLKEFEVEFIAQNSNLFS